MGKSSVEPTTPWRTALIILGKISNNSFSGAILASWQVVKVKRMVRREWGSVGSVGSSFPYFHHFPLDRDTIDAP